MKFWILLAAATVLACGMACTAGSSGTRAAGGNTNAGQSDSPGGAAELTGSSESVPGNDSSLGHSLPEEPASACADLSVGDKAVLKSQTFPFDHRPFERSCFVTLFDPDFPDPPLGSEIAIFRNGEPVYRFESQFGPDSATCWVIAVGFRDLNGDSLTDIIIVGKCGAKSGAYNANEVFINTGLGFDTNDLVNEKLEDFTTVEDIADFVKKNQQFFTG